MACVRRLQLECCLYLILISLLLAPALVASTTLNTSPPPDCHKCGNITIPYPFGTRPECCRHGFNIRCNESTTPPKAFLGTTNIELIDINITGGEARVHKHVGYRCYDQLNNIYSSTNKSYINLTNGPFLISDRRNKFTAIGCDTLAYIVTPPRRSVQSISKHRNQSYFSGCVSFCESLYSTTGDNGSCNGLGCCQTSIPSGLAYYKVQWGNRNNSAWFFNPCMYAVLVEEEWYKFQVEDLSGQNFYNRTEGRVPFVLDWAIRDKGMSCQDGAEKNPNPACLSNHSSCYNTSNGEGYLCQCKHGFEGNPYIPGGCTDIDECKFPDICHGNCTNTEGSYECSCWKGTNGNATIANCTKDPEKFPYPARVATSCILGVAILLGLCFLVVTHQQHKRHIKEKEEYQRYYQMMKTHLRVFSKKQIESATNNFAETHVLGRGGQGNVYKALNLIENNQVVAIKKAKEVEETQRGEFVNEIILLSQINHKNVVRLFGCCLEVKIPMLVYEFIPNGTLFEFLHRKSSRRSISLGTRLKIALDSAVALDHLHSSITRSIIHGDVKSANILLDADYTAKVSDFGASSVVPVNEIVELVHFSHGYLDPECLYTQIITKNSDVYSFGVVMLELVTRKAAVYIDESGEKQPLATCFLSKARKNEHLEMLDVEIVTNEENVMEVFQEICEIALQCLSPKGEDRPTMSQVVEELQKLVRFHNSSLGRQINQEEMESLLDETKFSSISDAYGFNTTQYSAVLEINAGAAR